MPDPPSHDTMRSSRPPCDRVDCTSFGAAYASIYDALYGEKDYSAEAQFALDQVRTIVPRTALQILDLGCGTGRHAEQLAEAGISVTGVDRSADMVTVADKRKELLSDELRGRLNFKIGDIRTVDFDHRYDAILSLFHVVSYMVENRDLERSFETARRHLDVGGAFLFDFLYAPAFLRYPPQQRVKTIQVGKSYIRRTAIPEWDRERRVVCVNYDIEIKNIASGETIREYEQHFVRCFFPNEIEKILVGSDFDLVRLGEWLSSNSPSESAFGVYALAKAK